MANLNNLKIPTTNNNMVLTTDEYGTIKDSNININSVQNATSVKTYYLDLSDVSAPSNITVETNPQLYAQLQNIFTDILDNVHINIFAKAKNVNYSSFGVSDTINTCTIVVNSNLIYIISNDRPSTTKNNSGVTYLNSVYNIYIQIMYTDNNISRIYYRTGQYTLESTILTTDNTKNGEQVTYLPEYDSQPANKKYVDQQIAQVQTQIGQLESTVDDILGQQESTETT